MKLKKLIASVLAISMLTAVCATPAFAANDDEIYKFDAMLDLRTTHENDAKMFLTGARGTPESTGIMGGREQHGYGQLTETPSDYVDDSIKWSLKDGTLVISGTGTNADFGADLSPFYRNTHIKTVIIEDSVTAISNGTFTGIPNLETIFVMNANTKLDASVNKVPKLKTIIYGSNLKNDTFMRQYPLHPAAIVDNNYETIVLTQNVVYYGPIANGDVVRTDINMSVYSANGVHTPVVINGVIQPGTENYSLAAEHPIALAVNSFKTYNKKLSYDAMLNRVRAYTKNLPQTAKNMLPKELTTGAASSTIQPIAPPKAFTTSGWAAADVKTAQSIGIVPDTLPTNLTATISRKDFCEIVAPLYEKITGQKISERFYFADTDSEAVAKLAGLGIIGGVGGDSFAPNNKLTRAEAAAIFARMGNKVGIAANGASVNFTDCVNHWAASEIQTCNAMGLITGTSATTFSPNETLTAEQAIIIALRAYNIH